MSGAQAADLPVKAKAVEYVRICSLYGAGFFYIPGTDTCIKLGGYLRADVTFNGGVHGAAGLERRSRPAEPLSRLLRRPLAYGADGRYPYRDRIRRGPHLRPGRLPVQQLRQLQPDHAQRRFAGRRCKRAADTAGGGYVAVEYLFIQFAGFTFGKSSSAYSTPWNGFRATSTRACSAATTPTPASTTSSTPPSSATACRPRSVSTTRPSGIAPAVYNLGIPSAIGANGTGSNAYAGTHAPDIVGRIRVDQAWGLFQISAAAHEVSGSYNTLGAGAVPTAFSEISGHPETKWGGSVMAALQIKNIPTGAGDDIKVDASYAKGTTKNVIATSGTSPSFAMFGGSGSGLPERRLRRDHRRRLHARRRRHWRHRLDDGLGHPRRVQSQLGSVLVVAACSAATLLSGMTAAPTTICWVPEPPRPRALTALPSPPATRVRRWPETLRATTPATPTSTSRSSARQPPLDTRQEPDVHGRSAVVPSRPEDVGQLGIRGDCSEAVRALRVQGSEYGPAPGPRPAQLLRTTSGPGHWARSSFSAAAAGNYLASLRRLTIAAIRPTM